MDTEYSEGTIQLPEAASTLAGQVDALYYQIFWISIAFFIGIVGCMVYFAWRYRRRPGVSSKPPGHHNALELFWTFSPLLLLAFMFHQGFQGFINMSVPPENAINIRVNAFRWGWEFEQPNGMIESTGYFTVPSHRPVRLVMASRPTSREPEGAAVLHSFFVPAFRIKRDIVPGMYTSVWFEANNEGRYQVYCTEYCGTGHSAMGAEVRVVPQEEYDALLRDGPGVPPELDGNYVAWGEQLFQGSGCTACHYVNADQGRLVGPNLANVAGTMQPLEGEDPVLADYEYIRNSIQYPGQQIVEGYNNQMPSYASIQNRPLNAIIAYLASLSPEHSTELYEQIPGVDSEGMADTSE
jgi:cytochrome c oxidase subunit 2